MALGGGHDRFDGYGSPHLQGHLGGAVPQEVKNLFRPEGQTYGFDDLQVDANF